MLAQLNCTEYFVDELSLEANCDHVSDEAVTGTVDIDFDIRRNGENPLDFMVSLNVGINSTDEAFRNNAYRMAVKVTGFFTFDEGTDEETMNRMIAPSGLAILYGAIRGMVATVTGTARHGKYILPSVNMMEVIKAKSRREVPTRTQKRKVEKIARI